MNNIKGGLVIYSIVLSLMISTVESSAQKTDDYNVRGKELLKKGSFREAVTLYNKAIQNDERNPEYFLNRGMAYLGVKEFQHAYEDFSKAIHIDNGFAEAYMARAEVLFAGNMTLEAINDYDMAVKYASNDSIRFAGMLDRSGPKLMVRNFEGAFEDSKAFYEHDSTSKGALINMAMSKLNLDEKEEALKYMGKALRLYPKDTIALMDMGFIYLKMEQYDSSKYYLEKTLEVDNKNAYAYSNLSFVKLKLKDLQGALKSVNYSLKLEPSNSYAYYNRALIYLEMTDKEKACADLRMAIQKGFTERYGNEVQDAIDKNCTEIRRK